MPRFILIDPWLDGVGGHNYQYAIDILQAAADRGYQPLLAANERFRDTTGHHAWPVQAVFRYQASSRYWLGPDGKCRHALAPDGQRLDLGRADRYRPLAAWRRLLDRQRGDRQRRIARYAQDLGALFAGLGWQADDVVFLPSQSEFDFLGVVRFLQQTPASRAVDWHLQFHFDIFSGRPHQYAAQQERLDRFRQQFSAALAQVPDHRLHFYATTEPMAAQYDRMQLARFQPLPYPVSGRLQPVAERSGSGPLRVTCAGAVRREKGRSGLAQLIQQLHAGALGDGQLQLVLQTDRNALRRLLPRELARRSEILPKPDPHCDWPVVPVAYPLAADDYAELIRQADVGLFLYDARRYYARASGVLVEMLAAGVPVIVPAGCWLADQLAAPHAEYLQGLAAGGQAAVALAAPAEIRVPSGAASAIVRVRRRQRVAAGSYDEITVSQFDAQARQLGDPRAAVLARRGDGGWTSSLTPLEPATRTLRVAVQTAFAPQPPGPWDGEVVFLEAAGQGAHPAATVGLVASSTAQIPDLLREMTAHYRHYRQSACRFAERWRADHAAARTVAALAANVQAARAGSAA